MHINQVILIISLVMFLSNILSYATPTWQHTAIYKAPLVMNTYRLQDKEKKCYEDFCAQSFHQPVKLPFQIFPNCMFFEKLRLNRTDGEWLPLPQLPQSHSDPNYFFKIKNIVHCQYRNIVSKENATDRYSVWVTVLGVFFNPGENFHQNSFKYYSIPKGFLP